MRYLSLLDLPLGQDLLDALVFVGGSEFIFESSLGGTVHLTLSSVPSVSRQSLALARLSSWAYLWVIMILKELTT